MNQRVLNTINELAELCVDSLMNFEDYDFEFDEDGACDVYASNSFTYKDCIVECSYSCYGGNGRKEYIEILLNPANDKHYLGLLEEAVNLQVKETLNTDQLLDAINEQARSDYYDEWEEHGFRDAADYYSWRYG